MSARRYLVPVVIALAAAALMGILERTGYGSWAERITVAMLVLATVVIVYRNVRDGRY